MQRQPHLARVFLIRHCKTGYNLERRIQGSRDIPLNEQGRLEAQNTLPLVADAGIQRIVSSPLRRAAETAAIYAHGLGVPLHIDPRLRELDHGSWEGQRFDELLATQPSLLHIWLENPSAVPIPGGSETIEQAQQRVVQAVAEIASRYVGENVLVVLHKHIRAILSCKLQGLDLRFFKSQIEERVVPVEVPYALLARLGFNT